MVAGLRDVTIVNSRATGRFVKQVLGERNQRVILNGWPDLSVRMRAADRDAMREEFGFPVGAVVLGNVGRMIPLRRQVMLIDLVHLLRTGFQVNAHLLIVGDGLEYDSARRRAHELGVRDYVSLVGAQRDVRTLLNLVDVYVNPTVQEGFGNANVEAMQHGLPVVLARAGSHPELIVHGDSGFLVSPDNLDDYASAVSTLVEDASLRERMSESARARATALFGLDRFVYEVESLLVCLASRGAQS
jgi:glycosyltransferase involved in cell wall biosynthesis